MAYHTHTKNPIGSFVEKDYGQSFEYSLSHMVVFDPEEFPHVIWVDNGFRFANVKKTLAYVVVDENPDGSPVIERWDIKNRKEYA